MDVFGRASRSDVKDAVRISRLQPRPTGFGERRQRMKAVENSEYVETDVYRRSIAYVGIMALVGLVIGGNGTAFYWPGHNITGFVGSLVLILISLFLLVLTLNGLRARRARTRRNSMGE
jgi:hypothetical protein